MVVFVVVKRVVQVRGLDAGLEVDISAFRLVVVSAVAADAGHHSLAHVGLEVVFLIGLRAGVHVGFVVATVRFLVAIRYGFSGLCLPPFRIRATGVPLGLLVNLI